jgi:hypothetical protein
VDTNSPVPAALNVSANHQSTASAP